MHISPEFQQRIVTTYGPLGVTWLASLDELLATLCKRHTLSRIQLMPVLSYNLVAQAQSEQYGPVVIKMSVDASSLQREVEALKWYRGNGAVTVLAQDASVGALLLEHLEPGVSLVEKFPQQDDQAVQIAAGVMDRLHQQPMQESQSFPSIEHVFTPLATTTYPQLVEEYERARGLMRDLLSVNDERVLCHGDLHHANILSSTRGWLSIDPKGVIAPRWFEVGCFIRNPLILLEYSAKKIIERRVDQFSALLGIERYILIACSYVQAVLATVWALEDRGDWEYFLGCARLMRS